MTKQRFYDVAPRLYGARFARAMRDRLNKRARNDDGVFLVEILVSMLILVIVFTTTTIALSNMADTRVKIEQRDRALSIVTKYEELSRIYQCGFLVDRIDDGLAKSHNGLTDFQNVSSRCDFGGGNPGDQNFSESPVINSSGSRQRYDIEIRYWWESSKYANPALQTQDCNAIKGGGDQLPLILTRFIKVTWKEKGHDQSQTLTKRDSVPSDSVVFASGTRVSYLVPTSTGSIVHFYPIVNGAGVVDASYSIQRIIDGEGGQPTKCAWFPYITPDGKTRAADNGSPLSPNSIDPSDTLNAARPGSFHIFS
jgi:hypothetical protein